MKESLFLIPARGGSKGIPKKNIKALNGRPLIHYTIDFARQYVEDQFICVSTDDEEIINVVDDYGLNVPFMRPAHLAADTSTSQEVVIHALEFYKKLDIRFDTVVLLQPTSPLRTHKDFERALSLYNPSVDLVMSVKKMEHHPYYGMYRENSDGYIEKFSDKEFNKRQDLPEFFAANGAIYIFNVSSLSGGQWIKDFTKIKKVEMAGINSVDIDDENDWQFCEFLMSKVLI